MTDSTLQPGFVRFIQVRRPVLEAGEYVLTTTQTVTAGSDQEVFTSTVRFAVGGEEFQIDPTEIDSVYPPAGSTGEYRKVLPHLVLNRPMLPWLRSTTEGEAIPDADGNYPAWLALLVVDKADPQPLLQPRTVANLQAPEADVRSYPLAEPLPFGLADTDPVLALDLSWDLFKSIAPSQADLAWLTSIRVVAAQKANAEPGASDGGEYAVLIANRLPKPGSDSTVHLVSLEGMADLLPGAGASPNPPPATVRLVSLYRWSFTAEAEPETFGGVIEALGPRLKPFGLWAGVPGVDFAGASSTTGVLDIPPADPVVAAMAMGYVGLPHVLRDGGQTASWYRGPFAPYSVEHLPVVPGSIPSSDAALRFDPATGLLDASYAAAWRLGQMLGIADTKFATALFRWKHGLAVADVLAAERAVMAQAIAPDTDAGAAAGGIPAPLGVADILGRMTDFLKAGVRALIGDAASDVAPFSRPEVLAAPAPSGAVIPDELAQWIERLRKLHGVPFTYLVPSEAMLEPEDLRFFHLNMNWIDALVEGALSIGASTAGDLNGAPQAGGQDAAASGQQVTGFLLRSRAVKHWPGLETAAFDISGAPLRPLRYERLAEDVLLCLLDGVIATVELHEPAEALHFGVDIAEPLPVPGHEDDPLPPITDDNYHKLLRDPVTGASYAKLPMPPNVHPLTWRAPDGALDIVQLVADARTQLQHPPRFTSAEFALTMVEGVDMVSFQIPVTQTATQ